MSVKEATIAEMETQFEVGQNCTQNDQILPGCLDGWKDIAAYLRRDVRTVQRWEKSLGLPVQRVQDSKSGSVYAYRSEIEAWRRARGTKINRERLNVVPPPATASECTTTKPARHVHPWALVALLAGWLLGAACSQLIPYLLPSTTSAHSSGGAVYARSPEANPNRTAFARPSAARQARQD